MLSAILGDGAPVARIRSFQELRADSTIWDRLPWPSRPPTLADVHWIAGLFEGEGGFIYQGTVCIWQKDREILDHVKRYVGGQVGRSRKRDPTMHYWHASGPRARGFVRTIYPLLSERRKAQARRFLRISRGTEEPVLVPTEPARYLWDFLPPGVDERE